MTETLTLDELAQHVEGTVRGDGSFVVLRIASLEDAGPQDLGLFSRGQLRLEAEKTRAGALILKAGLDPPAGFAGPLLEVDNPPLALARALERLLPAKPPAPGIHSTAVVDPEASVDSTASLGPYVVVGAASDLGPGVVVGAHSVIGRRCRLGARVRLHPHVVLYDDVELGDSTVVHAGAVLGADGFGYASAGGVHHKVPQVGGVEIGSEVEVGALSAIDRATLGKTQIGSGSKIDNLVQVGHNVVAGRGVILCGQVGLAGSTRLGDYVVMGGQSGAGNHIEIGDRSQVASASAAVRDVGQDSAVGSTLPAMNLKRWRRILTVLGRLDEMFRRLRRVEDQLTSVVKAEVEQETRE